MLPHQVLLFVLMLFEAVNDVLKEERRILNAYMTMKWDDGKGIEVYDDKVNKV